MQGIESITPTVLQIHERSKRFHADIARRAAELVPEPAPPLPAPIVTPPTRTLPPIPDHLLREAEIMLSILAEGGGKFGPRVEAIQQAVLRHFPGVTINDLLSARRDNAVIEPRQIAMYLCKALTTRSTTEIGRRFGGRDHTTVIHACKKIAARVAQFDHFAAFMGMIKAEIAS